MRKIFLKGLVCSVLAVCVLFSLASCGMKMESYREKVENMCNYEEVYFNYYGGDSEEDELYIESAEKSYGDLFGVEVEIDSMIDVYAGLLGGADVIEFETSGDAREFARAYKKYYSIDLIGKIQRIVDLITGAHDGTLKDAFAFNATCKRDGRVVICGSTEMVEYIQSY